MKITFTLILFTFCCLVIVGQKNNDVSMYYQHQLRQFELVKINADSTEQYKVIWVFKENPEQIAFEIPYYRNKKQGVEKAYFPNGKLRKTTIYGGGKENGECTEWDESGNFQRKYHYEVGLLDGTYYDKVGGFYGKYKKGKKHGVWHYPHLGITRGRYKKGEKQGRWKLKTTSGIIVKALYQSGKLINYRYY